MHQTLFGILRLHITFAFRVPETLIDVIELHTLLFVVGCCRLKLFVGDQKFRTCHAPALDDRVLSFDQVTDFDRRAIRHVGIGIRQLAFGDNDRHSWRTQPLTLATAALTLPLSTLPLSLADTALPLTTLSLPTLTLTLTTLTLTLASLSLALASLVLLIRRLSIQIADENKDRRTSH